MTRGGAKLFQWRGRWRDATKRQIWREGYNPISTAPHDHIGPREHKNADGSSLYEELINKHLPSRELTAIGSTELYERIVEDYGSLNQRVFFARLVHMRQNNTINFKRGDGFAKFLYWRKR